MLELNSIEPIKFYNIKYKSKESAMYYQKGSNNLNNDYYNAYAGHLNRESDVSDILTTIIKILAIIFLLTLIIFGYVFVSNQYYLSQIQAQEMQESKKQEKIEQEVIIGVNTIESVTDVLKEQKEELSSDDVSKIVHMVMLKMNSLKKEEGQHKKSTTQGSKTEGKSSIKNSHKDDRVVLKDLPTNVKNMRIIVVEEGDTLSTIAVKAYGNEKAYKKIYAANPEIIKDKDKIFVGQKIRIPK